MTPITSPTKWNQGLSPMEQGQLVITERRGGLALAVIEQLSPAKLRIRFEDGAENKVGRDRVVFVFEQGLSTQGRASQKSASAAPRRSLTEWLDQTRDKELTLTLQELEALWRALPEGSEFSYRELCQRAFGLASDREALALYECLQNDPSLVRASRGQLIRVPEIQREAARERADETRVENEQAESFEAFCRAAKRRPGGAEPKGDRLEPALNACIEGLRDYAISGPRPENKRAQRIAARLGWRSPDELLDELCSLGLVEVDVNEGPARLGWSDAHPKEVEEACAQTIARIHALEIDESSWKAAPLPKSAWTCTIDQDSTEDVDDAISFWPSEKGFGFAVHIADVDDAIPRGSTLDDWARARASTIYFRDKIWSMLPSKLVRDGLSLNPNSPRPCLSLIGECDSEARLIAPPILARRLVRVDERLSYDDTRRAPWRSDSRLVMLGRLSENLRRIRLSQGAVLVVQQQLEIEVHDAELKTRLVAFDSPGHHLVQEMMVLFSQSAGELLSKLGWPAFYRCQPSLLQNAGAVLVESRDEGLSALSRRFPPSRVSLDPGPHRSMGVPVYAQATAPIRRYSDLLTQRLMKAAIAGLPPAYSRDELSDLLGHQENRMSQIRRLEDQRLRHWQHRALEQDPGPRRALLSRVSAKRPYVYIPDLMLELPLDPSGLGSGALKTGHELSVIATEFSPRGHVRRLELADELDEPDWDIGD